VTGELSRLALTLSTCRASQLLRMEVKMVEQSCPWCEATLRVDAANIVADDEGTCPECLTTWMLEDEPAVELALAA
jgi:predicted Zn finger-like uncharacterized protein